MLSQHRTTDCKCAAASVSLFLFSLSCASFPSTIRSYWLWKREKKQYQQQKSVLHCSEDNASVRTVRRPCASPSAPPCPRSSADTCPPSRPCFWRLPLRSVSASPPAVDDTFALICWNQGALKSATCLEWWCRPPLLALWRLSTWNQDLWRVSHVLPPFVFWGFQPPLGDC